MCQIQMGSLMQLYGVVGLVMIVKVKNAIILQLHVTASFIHKI